MKKKLVLLETVVFEVVETFVNDAKSFSIHDITKEVRRRENAGLYEFYDLLENDDGGFDIEHDDVKVEFEYFLTNPVDYDLNLAVTHADGYRLFTPVVDKVVSPNAYVNISADPTFTDSVKDKITDYLTGRHRSIKQLQSRLKREGNFTCAELKAYLISEGILDTSKVNPKIADSNIIVSV